ncbi:unnamed protein product [Pylaiella littoralis]
MVKSPSTAPAIGTAVAGDTSGVQFPSVIDHSPARTIQPSGWKGLGVAAVLGTVEPPSDAFEFDSGDFSALVLEHME